MPLYYELVDCDDIQYNLLQIIIIIYNLYRSVGLLSNDLINIMSFTEVYTRLSKVFFAQHLAV